MLDPKNPTIVKKTLEWDRENPGLSLTLPSRYFFDKEIFEREIETIIYPSWHFVCHKSEILNIGDFVFTRTSGTSDPSSPHRIPVIDEGLLEGMHTDWALDLKGNLVDGTRYKITFESNIKMRRNIKKTFYGSFKKR